MSTADMKAAAEAPANTPPDAPGSPRTGRKARGRPIGGGSPENALRGRQAAPPAPNRPNPADAEALHAAGLALEAEIGPALVSLCRLKARLGWGHSRADRAYHELLNAGRWRWRELADHPTRESETYMPTEADVAAVREGWGPDEERARRLWQTPPARIPGADRFGA